ncbi:MAG: hypothetical protein O9345_05030 [Burkholderiaceae bacterium]|nr:hypothetical protein [Burkholderiaceae bacterium]
MSIMLATMSSTAEATSATCGIRPTLMSAARVFSTSSQRTKVPRAREFLLHRPCVGVFGQRYLRRQPREDRVAARAVALDEARHRARVAGEAALQPRERATERTSIVDVAEAHRRGGRADELPEPLARVRADPDVRAGLVDAVAARRAARRLRVLRVLRDRLGRRVGGLQDHLPDGGIP